MLESLFFPFDLEHYCCEGSLEELDASANPVWKDENKNRKEQEMNKKLYIGNLASGVTEQELKDNFATVGNIISLAIIKDKFTGLSKGFGFVEMETEEAAKEAITQFNGGELHGKVIVVNEARPPRTQGSSRGDSRSRPGGGFRKGPGGGGGGRRY